MRQSAWLHDPLGESLAVLQERIRTKEAPVCVVGLGYVGLPLLLAASNAGYPVIGYDNDPRRVESLKSGGSPIHDIWDSEIANLEHAEFASEPAAIKRAEVIVICVPTPLTDHTPDLTMVKAAAESVGRHLNPGRLVVLESTTYPGTTEEIVGPILERESGLTAGREFALAYSPERIDPGQRERRIDNTPKIVAGLTDACRDVASSFYSHLVREVVTTISPREAEMAKLLENVFRQVNIALVNEMAVLARELDVDIWDALSAAATKPFGYMPFWPGPGVGGHCISIDPAYLSWRAGQKLGYPARFIELANETNNRMPAYVVTRISEALNDGGKPLRGSSILAVGVTYKAAVDDLRESPSVDVIRRLLRKGAVVSYHDPFVPLLDVEGNAMISQELTPEVVGDHDCVALLTVHPDTDVRMIVRSAALVFDCRGATLGIDAPNVIRL